MKRFYTIFFVPLMFINYLSVADAQTVSIVADENNSTPAYVGSSLTYHIGINAAENVTGFDLNVSFPENLIRKEGWSTYGADSDGQGGYSDSGLQSGRPSIPVVKTECRAIAAGTGKIRVTGTLTTTDSGNITIDVGFPITILPPDPNNPLPARGNIEIAGYSTPNSPGFRQRASLDFVGIPSVYAIALSREENVAEVEVAVTYTPKTLGVAAITIDPGLSGATAQDSNPPGHITFRTPRVPRFGELFRLQFTPVRAGSAHIQVTKAVLKNSPQDTPGTVLVGESLPTSSIDVINAKGISNIAVVPADGQLTVTWDPVSGAKSYLVEVYGPSNREQIESLKPTVTLENLRNNSAYTIWVAAYETEEPILFSSVLAASRESVIGVPSDQREETPPETAPEPPPTAPVPKTDVNQDGKVNKIDLLFVVIVLGENPPKNPNFDVNDDGIVNITDVLLVIETLDDSVDPAAPMSREGVTSLDPALLSTYIHRLRAENEGSAKYEQAIIFFQGLLASIRPTETQLLANYPNPFNPETWIPYQLAQDSEVRISIYDARGSVVCVLTLGHQSAGYYTSRSRAAYWDGRNTFGERVASGLYLYQLQADNVSALRKMVILK